jgi:hypothetical protein
MFSLILNQKPKTKKSDNIWTHKNEVNEKFRILDFSGYAPLGRLKIRAKCHCFKYIAMKGVRTSLYVRGGNQNFQKYF